MRITAITKARALAMIEVDELNVGGKIRLSDCVAPIVDRYGFMLFPNKPEDFDLEKGVTFASGKSGELVVDHLVIYNGLIYVETLSSTEDSKRILLDILSWGKENLGLTYTEGMIPQWAYISQVVFYTDFPMFSTFSRPLEKLAKKTSSFMEELFTGLKYEPMAVTIGHDPMARKNGIAGFTIQRRANTPFLQNKYFSEAPLPTELHIQLLKEFESDVLVSRSGS